jgi:16S rRNA C1402 (ribose-2'-O) methylase RsmI
MVGRELSKIHQEFLHGTCAELAARLEVTKGELTVVVSPKPTAIVEASLDETALAKEFWAKSINGGLSRREVISKLAEKFSLSSKQVYAIVERSKRSGE